MISGLLESNSPYGTTAFLAVLVLTCLCGAVYGQPLTAFSALLHAFLCWRHPVRDVHTRKPLPTVPYRFPNGQGDAAKFLHGKENSVKWGKEYGPIYRIWSGSTPEIVLTKPEHIQEAFKDSDKHFKAVNNNSGYLMGEILGRCVGLISREQWKRVRAVCERPLLRPAIGGYIAGIERRTRKHFDELWAKSKLSEGIIDPAQDLKYLPFWIVAEVIYGQLPPEMVQELEVLAPKREALFKHVIAGGLPRFKWSKYLPTAANRDLTVFKAQWSSFNSRVREYAVKNGADAPIIQLYEAVHSNEMTEEELLHTLDEMLFANLDVTLGGVSWNLVFLASNPAAQERLRHEVVASRQAGEALFSQYILSSSTFLAACISESARLRPLAAFSVPQAAPTARVIGGYYFEAGTNFVIDSHALNQRNPYWGDDSTAFRPDRFFERAAVQARYNYWRFGFGPRQCMGKYVADVMIRILLVVLMEEFVLSMDESEEDWGRDMENWINHPQMKLRCKSLWKPRE